MSRRRRGGQAGRALRVLEALGPSSGAVYLSLLAMRVRGWSGDATACPLARLLERATGREWHVKPAGKPIAYRSGPGDVSLRLPEACDSFAESFDAGNYDELAEVRL